ncbi:Vgb family protein [Actinoplanes sp. HUAS TT8]|uniref:Vgb family protein n=1 Tax=Actinoplanes sp. HUAS TT8 TaxID=3447453 RepID=UPI003F525EAC
MTPYALAQDTAGTLWATILDPPGLARVSPGEFRHEEFPARPMLLAAAADGVLWCTRADDRLIRRDAAGTYTVIDLPAGAAPYGIAVADDAWFTAPGLNQLGRLTPAGDITWFDLPVPDARAAMITFDAGGRPWAALNGAGALATVHGDKVEIVELPGGRAPAAPVGITASADGVWYADIAGGGVGHVDPSGSVRQHLFDDPACRPHAVAPDPEGGCWATLWGSTELARVTSDGDVTLYPLPGQEPHGLWVTDSTVWVAMESGTVVPVSRRPE